MKKAVEWVLNLVTTVIAQACSLDAKYVTIQGGGDWDKMTSIVKEIYNYLAIAGIAFTLVYFLMEMNEKLALEGRDLTMKSFFAPFLKLMVAIAVISQSGKIVSSIIMFNDTFITKISSIAKAGDTTQADLAKVMTKLMEMFGKLGFFILLVVLIILMLTAIIGLVLKLVWWYKGMMYKLELLFRLSVLPIAVADIYGGRHSNAIRYIKGFLALGLYGVALVALPRIALTLATAMTTEQLAALTGAGGDPDIVAGLSCLLMYLVAPFAAIAASNVAKQVSKEALGA